MKFLLTFILMLSTQVTCATPINLIQNGDFSLTHTASQGGKTNFGIPDLWAGISGQTDNATVLNGVMTFATSGPRNPLYDRWYISQTFTVQNAGQYNLMFDFLLVGANTGSPMNGAKVFLDHIAASAFGITPVVVPNMIFAQTYAQEYSDILRAGWKANSWHVGQQLLLDLTAGTHTLFSRLAR